MKALDAIPGAGRETIRTDWLDALRAVAMLSVVATHAYAYVGLAKAGGNAWLSFLVNQTGVPAFLLVDGFLFGARRGTSERFDYAGYLKDSAQRLLVPWVIFSALYVVARALAEAWQLVPERIVLGKPPLAVAACVVFSCAALQMYFLLSLFLIRCFAPLTHRLVRGPAWMTIAVFLIATLMLRGFILDGYHAYLPTPGTGDPLLLALWGCQFYLFGLALARHAAAIRRRRTALLGLSVSLVFAAWRSPVGGAAIAQDAYLASLFLLFFGLRDVGWLLPRIGRETMGIYLLHGPVLMNGVMRLAASRVVDPYALLALVTSTCFLVALGLSLAISRVPLGGVLLGASARRNTQVR